MEKDAEMRLRRARSVGSQWTLPLLFYVSGQSISFPIISSLSWSRRPRDLLLCRWSGVGSKGKVDGV
eukprot:11467028-Prorocentrum_lima.AAC.1